MTETVVAGVIITILYTSIVWIFILSIVIVKWNKWAIQVGKARYNQTTGILEFDESSTIPRNDFHTNDFHV